MPGAFIQFFQFWGGRQLEGGTNKRGHLYKNFNMIFFSEINIWFTYSKNSLKLKSKANNGSKFQIRSKMACFNWPMDYFLAFYRIYLKNIRNMREKWGKIWSN